MSSNSQHCTGPLFKALNELLLVPSFKTGSEVANQACYSAETMKDWCEDKENEQLVSNFTLELMNELQGCMQTT